MRFNTKAATDMLEPGQYEAVVKAAKEKTSKGTGVPMIEVILTCYGSHGAKVDVFDYLLSTDDWQWKVRHFCESAGLDYEKGELLAGDCEDKNVRVWLEIESQPGYDKKNKVKDYLPRATPIATSSVAVDDGDIPF